MGLAVQGTNARATPGGRCKTALARLASQAQRGWTRLRLQTPPTPKRSVRIEARVTMPREHVTAQMALRGPHVRNQSALMRVQDTECA